MYYYILRFPFTKCLEEPFFIMSLKYVLKIDTNKTSKC